MLAGDTFLEGSLALGLSPAHLALVSDGLIGFVNPQIGLHLPFVMAWLRALQTGSGPLPQGPGRVGLTCLTLACLDPHVWAGASEDRAVCRWALAAANRLCVCRAECRWPQAALTLGGCFSLPLP